LAGDIVGASMMAFGRCEDMAAMGSVMAAGGHVDSYYAARTADAPAWSALSSSAKAEICVIGGGFAGLTTARELAARGRDVVLIEAERVGWGASGRNGGFVSAGYAAGVDAMEARLGIDRARVLYDLSRDGVAYVRKTIEAAGATEIIGGHGWLKVLRHDNPEVLLKRRDHMVATYGSSMEYWNTERLRATLATQTYFHALHDPTPFHIDPLAYARLLAEQATAAGARIFEGSPATAVIRGRGGWSVITRQGRVAAETVVLAGSAYQALGGLWPRLDRAILPVATYVVTSEPLGEALHGAIGFRGCIADTRRAGDYYRIVDGDRLLWGGRITTRRSEPRQLAEMLRADIAAIYPQLGRIPIAKAWSGLMGYAIHKMPIIRPLDEGLWAATAFGGHGLAATATGGLLVASAIDAGDDRWRLFDAYGPRWAGGFAGRMATQLAYWSMQLRDRLDEGRAG